MSEFTLCCAIVVTYLITWLGPTINNRAVCYQPGSAAPLSTI
jgi:hypothetical protein